MISKTVNRIYQGRAVKLELENNTGWEECESWESLLLNHHKIFQDAVNYYLLCFTALAGNKNRPTDGKTCPVYRLREQIEKKWEDFLYKGVQRNGMQKSAGKYLFPDNPSSTLEDCLNKALEGNSADKKSLHKALSELIEGIGSGGGSIQQSGVTFFPMFCEKNTKANFPRGKNKMERRKGECTLKTDLLQIETSLNSDEKYLENKDEIERIAASIQYSWLANISNRHPEKPVKDRLNKAVEKMENWIKKNKNKVTSFFNENEYQRELKNIKQEIESKHINESVAFEKTNMKTQAGLLFKYFSRKVYCCVNVYFME